MSSTFLDITRPPAYVSRVGVEIFGSLELDEISDKQLALFIDYFLEAGWVDLDELLPIIIAPNVNSTDRLLSATTKNISNKMLSTWNQFINTNEEPPNWTAHIKKAMQWF